MSGAATSIDAARVELLLNELRLPGVKAMWPKIAAQSDKEGWPAARFLATLGEHETADRAPAHRVAHGGGPLAGRQDPGRLRLRKRADVVEGAGDGARVILVLEGPPSPFSWQGSLRRRAASIAAPLASVGDAHASAAGLGRLREIDSSGTAYVSVCFARLAIRIESRRPAIAPPRSSVMLKGRQRPDWRSDHPNGLSEKALAHYITRPDASISQSSAATKAAARGQG